MTVSETKMIDIHPEELSNQERYKLLIGSIVPRPIAWVSTISAAGIPNLAPFSFFTGVCSTPLILCFAPMIRGSDGQKKDTLKNIEATQEFVVHIVSESLATQMNQTAGEYPPEINEFEAAGLTPIPSLKVRPFRIQEARIQMECRLHQLVTIGETVGTGSLVLGEVVAIHIAREIYASGHISTQDLNPIARLAGNNYAKVTETFALERPQVLPT